MADVHGHHVHNDNIVGCLWAICGLGPDALPVFEALLLCSPTFFVSFKKRETSTLTDHQ